MGYSELEKVNPSIKDKDSKIIHMKAGERISRKILNAVGYNPGLTEKIAHYISVHNNWILGDDTPYKECKEMAAFNDLDFLWATTSLGIFKLIGESIGKNPEEFYEYWKRDEKLRRRPFCCDYTRNLWKTSMKALRNSLESIR